MKKKQKTSTVWKAVLRNGRTGRLTSVSPPSVVCRQEYSIRKINRPLIKGSGMFVFRTKRDAIRFAAIHCGSTVFRASATGVSPIYSRMAIGDSKREIQNFWSLRWWLDSTLLYSKTLPTPRGALICKTLKLGKEVWK